MYYFTLYVKNSFLFADVFLNQLALKGGCIMALL